MIAEYIEIHAPDLVRPGCSDGLDPASPLGSTSQVESASAPGDVIIVLPAAASFEGGLELKPRQILRGVPSGARRPVITNTSEDRHGGVGVVLADGARVEGIEIRDTHASGILGQDVSDVVIADVLIQNANTGRVVLDPSSARPHGGVTLLASPEAGSKNLVLRGVRVLGAAGSSILTSAVAGSEVTLSLLDVEVKGGTEIGSTDFGVAAFAIGPSARVSLEMIRSRVNGRMSRQGRNVVLTVGDHGTVHGLIYESAVGESGQDGVIAINNKLPANVELAIVRSTIENAAQSNVEGTFLAQLHEEADVLASRLEISIHHSTIRGAGSRPGFENGNSNINLTGSFIPRNQPLLPGRYVLRVIDSEIVSGRGVGLKVGTRDEHPTVDPGDFDLLLRGTRFEGNQLADVLIGASNARVDARGNCWVFPDGKEGPRVVISRVEKATPIDASKPMPCSTAR